MKNSSIAAKRRKPPAGSRIIASLQEAVDWAEGKDVAVQLPPLKPRKSTYARFAGAWD